MKVESLGFGHLESDVYPSVEHRHGLLKTSFTVFSTGNNEKPDEIGRPVGKTFDLL